MCEQKQIFGKEGGKTKSDFNGGTCMWLIKEVMREIKGALEGVEDLSAGRRICVVYALLGPRHSRDPWLQEYV